MDVWRITVAVLRRWYVFLPLVAVTLLGAFVVGEGVAPQYEAGATAILVPGSELTEIESPYGNMNDTTQVLSIVIGSTEARDAIEQRGLSPAYEISARDRSNIFNVMVVTSSPEESLATLEGVLELAERELTERQGAAGVPAGAQIGLQVLQPPAVMNVALEGKMRNMAVVGILGGALALLVTVLFDDLVGLVKRWHRRRDERRAPGRGSSGEVGRRRREKAAADVQHAEVGRPESTDGQQEARLIPSDEGKEEVARTGNGGRLASGFTRASGRP